jgi:hypothetical protein
MQGFKVGGPHHNYGTKPWEKGTGA